MTEDGTAEYTYDAENRLIKVVKSVAGNTEVQYTYDYMGRRVRSKSFYYGNPNGDIKYVFDGWLAVAELNGSISDQFVRAYTWGQDLSGSRDGAGGVGGLLSMTRADGVDYGYFYDANGNVTQVVRLTDGQVSANYKYDPFGNSIGQFDSINNPFRYSTKASDYLTQLYYYGYRFYSPRLGRWITRDPIGEAGGMNLNGFVANNSINLIDFLGFEYLEFLQGRGEEFFEIVLHAGDLSDEVQANVEKILSSDIRMVKTVIEQTSQTGNLHQVPNGLYRKLGQITKPGQKIKISKQAFALGIQTSLDIYSYVVWTKGASIDKLIDVHDAFSVFIARKTETTCQDVCDSIVLYMDDVPNGGGAWGGIGIVLFKIWSEYDCYDNCCKYPPL